MRHRHAALAIVATALVSCSAPRTASRPATPAAEASSYSLYDIGSTWRDQRGEHKALASLAGRPVVVALVYTRCASTCPLIVESLKRIAAMRSDVAVALISLDPEHDDPSALAAYARRHALSDRWTLLTGTAEDVRDVSAVLALRYRRSSGATIDHSNTITLLDAAGRIVTQQPSWAGDAVLASLPSTPRTTP